MGSCIRERASHRVYFCRRNAPPSMIPFLHLGPLTIPTFGLMVATGLLVAAYLLQADFDRRREQFLKSGYQKSGTPSHHDEGFLIIGIAGLAGLVGAKLYHAFQDPSTWKAELISRYGFACFGGRLRHRAHWLPALRRRRLRCADDIALGDELFQQNCVDHRKVRGVGFSSRW